MSASLPGADRAGESGGGRSPESLVTLLDYPLFIVTTYADAEPSGCLAGFVTQSSIDPVQFLICISKVNHTFGIAQRAEGLALHLLGADQGEMASQFGEQSGDQVDKFAGTRWSAGVTGAPILAECAAWVEGRIIHHFDAGDHEAFVVGVAGGGKGSHRGEFMVSQASDFKPGHPA